MRNRKLIIIGASGHGKVILDIALQCGYEVLGFLDDDESKQTWAGYPVLGKVSEARVIAETICAEEQNKVLPKGTVGVATQVDLVIAIGSNGIRRKIDESFLQQKLVMSISSSGATTEKVILQWATLIHPTAVIDRTASISAGSVIMANAVINADAVIGKHCIINTAAVVEHDNVIEDYVHISPRAVLAGTVTVGMMTHIGVGAVVKNNCKIDADCIIGAGAIVVKDIVKSGTYIGVPATMIGAKK